MANRLSDLGRREEALAQAEEAVGLYRQLAQQRPDAFLPDLGMSLNNLAKMLSGLGRREEALARAEESVRLYCQLAQQRPDAFLPDLARSLNNLAAMLSALGRREEALARAEEAVHLYRQLAQQHPDAFLPYLATSLAVLGKVIAEERPGEAMGHFAEAIRILTPFVSRLPQAHAPLALAMCRDYLQAAESAGIELDGSLLAPVIAILEKLDS
jgi:tetratricopeptide (TPR) repeat protein